MGTSRDALEVVGERFQSGEYFIPSLIYSAEIMREIGDILKPKIKASGAQSESLGKVLMGTVAGDVHDIGKNVVTFMLQVNGFEVKDLGVDVAKETFIREIRAFKPDVLGLSGLMTSVYDTMKETIEAVEGAGLRKGLKVIIGGGQIDETVRDYTKADAFATDAGIGVQQCKVWMGGD